MKTASTLIEWAIEVTLAGWLFGKLAATYVLSGMATALTVTVAYVAVGLFVGERLPQSRRPLLLIGLPIVLSIALVGRLTSELSLVAFPGWSSKEMMVTAHERGIPLQSEEQWFKDEVERIRSLRNDSIVLLAVLCLVYWKSYSRIRLEEQRHRMPELVGGQPES